jgi:hypothetical protein
MNQKEASALVAMMLAHYPGARFEVVNAQAYEARLLPLEARDVQEAIEWLVTTSKFVPVPADIVGETIRLRRERAKREHEKSTALRLPAPGGWSATPSAAEWGAALPAMLESGARHKRLAAAWYRSKGKTPPEDPGAEYVAMVSDGAGGKDVAERLRKSVLPGGAEDLERRFP